MDSIKSSAPALPRTHHERPHVCYEGAVYIGHLVEEDGDYTEIVETVPCRRCAAVMTTGDTRFPKSFPAGLTTNGISAILSVDAD